MSLGALKKQDYLKKQFDRQEQYIDKCYELFISLRILEVCKKQLTLAIDQQRNKKTILNSLGFNHILLNRNKTKNLLFILLPKTSQKLIQRMTLESGET